jgi:ATP-dependent Clp protease ATP-binding subunit ClpA
MGARPVKRYIEEHITNQLSDEILFGALTKGGNVHVSFNEKLILEYES